jgi:hypothetical protein
MEHKIINTGSYLLIVDESEIKKETYCYDSINNILVFYKGSMKNIGFQKVISHLPLNNSPILEGVDLLPPLKDEVDEFCNKHSVKVWGGYKDDAFEHYDIITDKTLGEITTFDFKTGYNKAKEKYKYTEEDLRKVIKMAWEANSIDGVVDLNIVLHYGNNNDLRTKWSEDEIVQSLQQPKILVGFKCEMVCGNLGCIKMALNGENSVCCGDNMEPKTTTNSQDLTQWVGEYIY